MVRPLRIQYPGAVYHVTARGNKKQNIFTSTTDRRMFLKVLSAIVKKYNWRCYAYCLMGNHYHLAIETIEPNLSEGMRDLNGIFTQSFNRVHHTVGHILQGRYHTFLIEKETYLLEVCRYIVLNPVRAGFVQRPDQWTWSSYRATAGTASTPDFLDTEGVLLLFGAKRRSAQKQYVDFVREGIHATSPFDETEKSGILGSLQFVRAIAEERDDSALREVPRAQRIHGRPTLHDLFHDCRTLRERNVAIVFAIRQCGYRASDVARLLDLSPAMVSYIVRGEK